MYFIILGLFIESNLKYECILQQKKTHEFILQCGFSCVFSRVPYLHVAAQMP